MCAASGSATSTRRATPASSCDGTTCAASARPPPWSGSNRSQAFKRSGAPGFGHVEGYTRSHTVASRMASCSCLDPPVCSITFLSESVHSGLGARAGTPSQYTLNADRSLRTSLNAMRISVSWCLVLHRDEDIGVVQVWLNPDAAPITAAAEGERASRTERRSYDSA